MSRSDGRDLRDYVMHRSESRKARGARLGPRALVEPRNNPVDIERGSDRDVLSVGLRHAPKTGAPQAKGPHPL